MKKILFLCVIVFSTILFTLSMKAQTYEHFSAFSGIPSAKAKVQKQGFTDFKLIFIGAYSDILKTSEFNTATDGNTQNWYYIFACNNDSKLLSIGVTKLNGVYIADLVDNCSSDQIPKIGNIERVFSDFKELPADLLNSDSVNIKHSGIKRKIQTDTIYTISRIELSIQENTQVHSNNSVNGEYIWLAKFEINDYPFEVNSDSEIFFISAITGVILDWGITTDIKEISNNQFSLIYPNPAKDILDLKFLQSSNMDGISIFNLNGLKIMESEYKEQINVSDLQPGIYFLKYGNKTYKFIREN